MSRLRPVPAWILALVVVHVLAGTALAHARLVGSFPEDGQRLDRAPAEFWLRFSEPVEAGASRVELLDGAGRPVAGTRLHAAGDRELRLAVPALAPGAYALSWTVLARDGHTTSGSLRFELAQAAPPSQPPPPPAPEQAPPAPQPAPDARPAWWWWAPAAVEVAAAAGLLLRGRRR